MNPIPKRGTPEREAHDQALVKLLDDMATTAMGLCPAPVGHAWAWNPQYETSWFLRDVVSSVNYGASAFLRLATPDDNDERQFKVELRMFPDLMTGRALDDGEWSYRITVFASLGRPFWGKSRDILTGADKFYRGRDPLDVARRAGAAAASALLIAGAAQVEQVAA